MVMQTFRTTLPNVHQHLQKRPHFCDFLLQTGIFTDPNLDRQHHQLYDRLLRQYRDRYEERRLFGLGIYPDHETQYSDQLPDSD